MKFRIFLINTPLSCGVFFLPGIFASNFAAASPLPLPSIRDSVLPAPLVSKRSVSGTVKPNRSHCAVSYAESRHEEAVTHLVVTLDYFDSSSRASISMERSHAISLANTRSRYLGGSAKRIFVNGHHFEIETFRDKPDFEIRMIHVSGRKMSCYVAQ